MNGILKQSIFLIAGLALGPLLAFYYVMYGDGYTLSNKYKFIDKVSDEWELLFVIGLFWLGFYCLLMFWKDMRKYLNKPPVLDWWQKDVLYQIYVKSFKDSNKDGYGDLKGIIEKLDYLDSIGVKSLWLSPIYPSSHKDGGYDITSFVDIDPLYGTMKDFEELVEKVHQRGMHILLDFVPNHTSDQHMWFKESCKSDDPSNPYRDFYVWYPSEDKVNPPNNWKSVFGHSAWNYVESRKAWYLHQFLPEQPDLNFRCPAVRKEIKNILRFWLEEKKIDGFRIDAMKHLVESQTFEDEPIRDNVKNREVVYDDLIHIYTSNQEETYGILYDWRQLCNEIGEKTGSSRALVVEASYDVEDIGRYYHFENKPNAHLVFNFQFTFIKQKKPFERNENEPPEAAEISESELSLNRSFTPSNVKRLIDLYMHYLPKGCWSNFQIGNHDTMRAASRIGCENINIANALNMLLGGKAVVYYGEEIGMENYPRSEFSYEDCQDEWGKRYGPKRYLTFTRDMQRTPMQWDTNKNSGFTDGEKPWLPVNHNYMNKCVEKQLGHKRSHLEIFKELVKLRKEPSFLWGKLQLLVVNDQIFSFTRSAFGFATFLVVMNFSDSETRVNLLVNNSIAPRAYVKKYISGNIELNNSTNSEKVDLVERYKVQSPVLTKNVILNPHDCLILTWPSTD